MRVVQLTVMLGIAGAAVAEENWKGFVESLPMQEGPYKPTWESMAAQYQVPEWFRDAKLGIFMHWGPCSVPARHGWYGLAMCDPDTNAEVFEYHRKTYGHQSVFGYKDLIPLWKAEKWKPDALVREFKAAGARYIMPVGVHHDNFDNYDSAYQPWNSVNMGPKRDIVGEWRKAALKEGLHFTVSTHQHESWDWFHRSYNFDKTGDKAGVPWDAWQTQADGKGKWWEGYDPADLYVPHFLPWDPKLDVIHHKMLRTDRGDWPNDRDILDDQGKVIGTVKIDPDAQTKFIRNWYLRTKDLIDKYHPEIVYFDWGMPFSHLPCRDACYLRLQAHYYNSSMQWNDGKMLVGANLKHIKHWPVQELTGSHDQIRRSCVEDFEGGRAGDLPSVEPWQQCDSVNNEWFDDTNNPKRVVKKPVDVINRLVSIVARNGNLLLNIALKADGTVCPSDQTVLDSLTRFMSVNGEAIHETRPWVVAVDRPTETYFTTKKSVLYATVMRWPDNGKMSICALAEDRSPWIASVNKVSLLGDKREVKWVRTAQGMQIELPGERPADFLGMCLKLEGTGTPVVATASAPAELKPPEEQDRLELDVRKHFGGLAGKPADDDKLRGVINDAIRDGLGCFSGFVATVEAVGKQAQGTAVITLRSAVNAESVYILKIARAELSPGGRPLANGDRVLFDARCEGASIKTSTVDFPEFRGYVTGLRRLP